MAAGSSESATTSGSSSSQPTRSQAHQVLFDEGLQIRREVTGSVHVQRSSDSMQEFPQPMQEFATEAAWGLIWGRPGLDRRTRSLLNLAMLMALGKSTELGVHVRGAVANGCTPVEIQEAILSARFYAGMSAGLEGVRVAKRAFDEMAEETASDPESSRAD